MEEAKDPELTAKLVALIREADVEGIKAELDGIDDVDIALVIILYKITLQAISIFNGNLCPIPIRIGL